jgi:hypothetical protein
LPPPNAARLGYRPETASLRSRPEQGQRSISAVNTLDRKGATIVHAPTKGTIHDPSWRAFAAWCRRLALCPLPAHPWTVGAFLRWCEERPGAVAVAEAVVAIAAVHARRGYERPERHVIVRRTLAALARRRGAVPGRIPESAVSGATVLFRAGDFAVSCAPRATQARVKTLKPRPQKAAPAGTTRASCEGTPTGMTRALSPAPKLVARRQYRAAH